MLFEKAFLLVRFHFQIHPVGHREGEQVFGETCNGMIPLGVAEIGITRREELLYASVAAEGFSSAGHLPAESFG